ncbi:MAG: hypothetical protein ABIR32_13690, partial [Ilumatobacteraceae bacterium]
MQTNTLTSRRRRSAVGALLGIGLMTCAITGVSAGPSNVPRLEVSLTDSSAQPPAVLVSTDPIRVLDT